MPAHLNIRFVFQSSTRISSFFPFKDEVLEFLKSGVVYLLKYVDVVTRCMWVKTHATIYQGVKTLGNLSYNRKTVTQSCMSDILSHLNSTGHSANFDNFKLLSNYSL